MFSKRFEKKQPRKRASAEGNVSVSPSLPKTIYLMNADELHQTALAFMPKDRLPLNVPPTTVETKPVAMPTTSRATDVDPVSSKSIVTTEKSNTDDKVAAEPKEGEISLSSFDGTSLDELFLQHSVRKPPPKTNSRKHRDSCQDSWTFDSLEMDECTLFSSASSPLKKDKKSRRCRDEDELSPSLEMRESLVSPRSGGMSAADIKRETGAMTGDSLSRNEPDMSFLDDIF